MPLRNRVTPLSELVAEPGRGLVLHWSGGGYGTRAPRPSRGAATVITPPSLLAVLRRDWRPVVPLLHPSADDRSRSGVDH